MYLPRAAVFLLTFLIPSALAVTGKITVYSDTDCSSSSSSTFEDIPESSSTEIKCEKFSGGFEIKSYKFEASSDSSAYNALSFTSSACTTGEKSKTIKKGDPSSGCVSDGGKEIKSFYFIAS